MKYPRLPIAIAITLATTLLGSGPAAADPGDTSTSTSIPAPADVAAPPPTTTRTPSGLAYRWLARGPRTSRQPTSADRCEVHYTGWTTDGQMFDSSVTRGRPVTLPVRSVIPGFAEALELMREGDEIRVWIPANLAYGTGTARGRPSGMLVFDIRLIRIVVPTPSSR